MAFHQPGKFSVAGCFHKKHWMPLPLHRLLHPPPGDAPPWSCFILSLSLQQDLACAVCLSTVSMPCLLVCPSFSTHFSLHPFSPSQFYPSFPSVSECWESHPGFPSHYINNLPVRPSFSPAGHILSCLTPCLVLLPPGQDLWIGLSASATPLPACSSLRPAAPLWCFSPAVVQILQDSL